MQRRSAICWSAPPAGQQIPLSELADIHEASGASFIYREDNSRYIGVQYSVEGRDLQSAVLAGQRAIEDISKSLPPATGSPGAESTDELLQARAPDGNHRPAGRADHFHDPVRALRQLQISHHHCLGVILTGPVGALIALKLTHTPFSVSSALGLLALMGVSVETAVILVSYINKLRLENKDIRTATREASLLRSAAHYDDRAGCLPGLLPAALSTGIGSDTQKPLPS
jgi:cobalt-zinc-cadmium resistance protein CzcA